jgi:tetratricopeptide (TPR) repeat protein
MSTAAGARPRLSIAMIARDAAGVISASLQSVRAIADEIVVLDTGSRDATGAIAQSAGARVISVAWEDDFAAARNRCLDELTGDWVLWIDAGEQLSPRCAAPLRDFVDRGVDLDKAYLVMVEAPATQADGDPEQAARIRLMPRRAGLRFVGRVRESIKPAMAQLGMELELAPWRILRTMREHDADVKRERALRNLRLIEREVQERGPSAALFLALGEACVALQQPGKARDYFRRALGAASRGSTDMLSAYYGLLTCQADSAEPNAPLELCIAALEVFPYDSQLLCAMGAYLQQQGHLPLAQRSYRAAHQFGQVDPETWHVRAIGEIAAICLSLNLQLSGDDPAAMLVLDEAFARYPQSPRVGRRRLELHVKHGQTTAALAEIDRLGLDRAERDVLRSAVRGACVASQRNWIPALAYLETAYSAGCRDPLCLRWYVAALVATGNPSLARKVLDDWAQLEPDCVELAQVRKSLSSGDTPAEVVARQPGSGVPRPHLSSLGASRVASPPAAR